jgi:hypothetical protein
MGKSFKIAGKVPKGKDKSVTIQLCYGYATQVVKTVPFTIQPKNGKQQLKKNTPT